MDAHSSYSTINLSNMLSMLSEASGQSIPDVIDHEMSRILEKCIKLTPTATEASVIKNVVARTHGYHKTGVEPKKAFKGKLSKNGYKNYDYRFKYPDTVWNEICRQRIESMNLRMSHIGIAKQSWARLAEIAGLKIKEPKKVKNLPESFSSDFAIVRHRSDSSYSLTLVNSQPTAMAVGGQRIARMALVGRITYFKTNLLKGALSRMKGMERSYKGLTVTVPQGDLE